MSFTPTTATQILSISSALLGAGGIAALSLFDLPILQSQPASRSLPSIRWLFSRGSHVFPQAAFVSGAGFTYLAYAALPTTHRTLLQLLKLAANGSRVNAYLAAAALTMSIAPITSVWMVPAANFELIELNEKVGGTRSAASARQQQGSGKSAGSAMSAEESVDGKGQPSQFADLSGPQREAGGRLTEAEERRVQELLERFKQLNMLRAVMMAAGGMVGVWAAVV